MNTIAQTPEFTVRQFSASQQQDFVALFTDERITRFIPKRTLEETHQLFNDILEEYRDGTGLNRWAIVAKTDELIGFGMLRHDTEGGKAELGYALNYKFWNMGLATKVSKTLVAYGFKQKQLTEIFAVTTNDNVPSQRVLIKAGLKRNGIISRKGIELALFNITSEEYYVG